MDGIFEKAKEASQVIESKIDGKKPTIGIILGTGLGDLSHNVTDSITIPYDQIPGFSESTTATHAGVMTIGTMGDKTVLVMHGRFHFYEGYSLEEVTFPVRVMKMLGIKQMIVTNAAGGMNPLYQRGDMVAITDHINFMGVNPLIGKNDNRLGQRFPDMIEPYSERLIALAEETARDLKLPLQKGVYIGVTGPCLETRAEYRMMRMMGADLVGMSTVPEVIAAVHADLEVFGLSCATDMCLPDALEPVKIEEIIETANQTGKKMNQLVTELIKRM